MKKRINSTAGRIEARLPERGHSCPQQAEVTPCPTHKTGPILLYPAADRNVSAPVRWTICLLAACACLALVGCGTTNVNPSTPRANTGYVDFYTDTNLDLSWEIKQAATTGGEMKTLFSEFEPVPENILRLAVPPGTHTFRVWFINRVTDPQTVTTAVENSRVTPVHVVLEPTGTASVQNKEYGFHPSAKGYGRGTKIVVTDSQAYRINATPGAAVTYQPKERMAYFAAQPKP